MYIYLFIYYLFYTGPEFYLLELGTSLETENSSQGATGTPP